MSLPPGQRLGAYEVGTKIGEGGMGQVYRAHDVKLGRDVAIKILPASVSQDPDRLARFEREAQAVASLSHPNVVSLFEFGAHEGQPFVVMELLEGQTLRDALVSGPLPVRKAIEVATQIARGLAAAHDKHLIHRDLKPENVFLLRDGQVKILDFGLARVLTDAPAGTGATETIARTNPGTVMGTVGYMAPEQVRGGPVDARTDLFALGAVLYEMVSGSRAFQRETAAESLTAILREDVPEIARTRADVPPAVDRIVQHALEKNPNERFQTARDIGFALSSLSGSSSGSPASAIAAARESATPRASSARTSAGRVIGMAAATAIAAGAIGWWLGQGGSRSANATARFDQFTQLTDEAGVETMPRISPDGASFAYVRRTSQSWDIYVQRVGGRQALAVAADPARDERWPAFSPDGRQIAFNEGDADGGIFIIGATGESERRLTDFGFNPAFSPDGKSVVFSAEEVLNPYIRNGITGLHVVDAGGGTPRLITTPGEDAVQPAWSPSGRRIAAWQAHAGQRDLITMAADGSDRVVLIGDAAVDYAPTWSPDGKYLYFSSDRGGSMALWRLPMDEATGRATGDPESVSANVEAAMDQPSLSADGRMMVFRSLLQSVNPMALPFDPVTERAGTPRALTTRTGVLNPHSVSPDNQWLLLGNQGEIREDLFVMRVDGTGLRRLTDDMPRDRSPRWAPDGKSIVFYSNRDGAYAIFSIRPDGSNLTRLTAPAKRDAYYPDLSPVDGTLVYADDNFQSFFFAPPFARGGRPRPAMGLEVDGGVMQLTAWSPDGKLISGPVVSRASGNPIGVGMYDVATQRGTKLTDDAGQWSVPFLPDGRRLMYVTTGSELVVLDIATRARRVVPVALGGPVNSESYAIAPDGRTIFYGAHRQEANVWMVTPR